MVLVLVAAGCKKKSADKQEPPNRPADALATRVPSPGDAAAALACPVDASSLGTLVPDGARIEGCLEIAAPGPAVYLAAVEGDAGDGGDVIVHELIVSGPVGSLEVRARATEHLGGMAAVRWSGPFTSAVDLDGDKIDELVLVAGADQGGEVVHFVEAARISGDKLEAIEGITTGFENAATIVDENQEAISCASEVELVERDDEIGHGAIVVRAKGPSVEPPCPPRGTTRWIARGDRLVQPGK